MTVGLSLCVPGTPFIPLHAQTDLGTLIASIKSAAKTVAENLRALYPSNETWFVPGEFGLIQTPNGANDKGYYWWEAGAAMGVSAYSL